MCIFSIKGFRFSFSDQIISYLCFPTLPVFTLQTMCKLENKKCSNSCKKCCKCKKIIFKKRTIKKWYILEVYVAKTSQNSQHRCPKWFPSKATTQNCSGKLCLAQENITTAPIPTPPRVHGSDLLCNRAFKHL